MPRPRSRTQARIGVDLCVLRAPYPASLARCVRSGLAALRARGDVEVVPLGPLGGSRRHWRLRGLPRAARRSEVDGVHSFVSGFAPLAPAPRVQTVHELPWRHGERENADRAHRLWVRLGPLAAARVVVPSRHVARDLAAATGRDRATVIPWGVEPRFGAADGEPLTVAGERIDRDVLLLPLGGRSKKRADRAVAALAALDGALRVVVTGPDGPGLARARREARARGIEGRLRHVPWIDEDDLPRAFAAAGAVLCLARSEGFAHPVLEGLAAGRPVVAAPGGAQEELLAGAGELADPDDPEALAAAIERALAWRPARADAARARAGEFTWERWAASTARLWNELLAEGAA